MSMRIFMVVSLSLVLAACSGGGGGGGPTDPPVTPPPTTPPAQPGPNEVFMVNIAFNPPNRTVTAGTTVTWRNNDTEVHTVTPQGHTAWQPSGNLGNGQTFSVTFNTPGTYAYRCDPHPAMTGTITVQ